jgi:hypothetical protein
MQRSLLTFKLSALAAIVIVPRLFAGTLEDAPFRVVVPSSEWQIEDSTAQPMGKDVFLAATVSNTNTSLQLGRGVPNPASGCVIPGYNAARIEGLRL